MEFKETAPRLARTDREVEACFPVMSELRPHLERGDFLATVRRMEAGGYRLAFIPEEGRPVAVAGYRITHRLWCGRLLYVDDLVTASGARSRGHGSSLLRWLMARAREAGCTELHLDSGVQREDAHRFYEANGMAASALHFQVCVGPGVAGS